MYFFFLCFRDYFFNHFLFFIFFKNVDKPLQFKLKINKQPIFSNKIVKIINKKYNTPTAPLDVIRQLPKIKTDKQEEQRVSSKPNISRKTSPWSAPELF